MNISLEKSALMSVLPMVAGIVDRRQTLPILNNLAIEAIEAQKIQFTATDLELQISSTIGGEVKQANRLTVPAKKFVDICRVLPDDKKILMKSRGNKVILEGGTATFELSSLPFDEYPKLEGLGGYRQQIELESSILLEILEKTAFAMAHQDVRFYLNGLLISIDNNEIIGVATDGHRLAKAGRSVNELTGFEYPVSIIVPEKTVAEIKKIIEGRNSSTVKLSIGDNGLLFESGDTMIASKLIDGKYPDFNRVIPSGLTNFAMIKKADLRDSLIRTAVLCYEKQKAVRMEFEKGIVRLETVSSEKEIGQEEVKIEFDGVNTSMAFNVGYWLDVLGAIKGPDVKVSFKNSDVSSVVVDPNYDDDIFVIMPVKI